MASMQNVDYSGSKELLLSYCKSMFSEIGTQHEQSQDLKYSWSSVIHVDFNTKIACQYADNSQKGIILNVYHDKCLSLIKEISSIDSEALSYVVLSNTLQNIAQLVLDFTYVEECCLVDQDFLLQAAYERVTYIIETLSGVEGLTIKAAPDNNPQDTLSPSLVECIHWRKGALLYMYCHTLNSQCSREKLPAHFLQCLQNGSKHLVAMLSTRSSPVWLNLASDRTSEPDMLRTSDDDGDMLLSQGIYSDTHLLALMYLGEMCYWFAQLTQAISGHQCVGHGVGDNMTTSVSAVKSEGHLEDITDTSSSSSTGLGDKQTLASSPAILTGNDTKTTGSHSVPLHTVPADPSTSSLDQGQSLDMLRVGQLCLQNYISAAKGPMSAGGWNTDRAEEILQYFGKLSI